MNFKSLIIIAMIGSSFAFSNMAMRESIDRVQQENINSTNGVETKEVIFWITILFVLGASIIILLQSMEIIFNTKLLERVTGHFETPTGRF